MSALPQGQASRDVHAKSKAARGVCERMPGMSCKTESKVFCAWFTYNAPKGIGYPGILGMLAHSTRVQRDLRGQ